MASPTFQISLDGGTTWLGADVPATQGNAAAYASSGTYSVKTRLVSTAGVAVIEWLNTSTDELSTPVVFTVAADKSATTAIPKTGGAYIIRARVNNGINEGTNLADPTYVSALALHVKCQNGREVLAVGSGYEVDRTYGWAPVLNASARAVGSYRVLCGSALTLTTATPQRTGGFSFNAGFPIGGKVKLHAKPKKLADNGEYRDVP